LRLSRTGRQQADVHVSPGVQYHLYSTRGERSPLFSHQLVDSWLDALLVLVLVLVFGPSLYVEEHIDLLGTHSLRVEANDTATCSWLVTKGKEDWHYLLNKRQQASVEMR
jgi:hypothetical protein